MTLAEIQPQRHAEVLARGAVEGMTQPEAEGLGLVFDVQILEWPVFNLRVRVLGEQGECGVMGIQGNGPVGIGIRQSFSITNVSAEHVPATGQVVDIDLRQHPDIAQGR